MSATSSGRTTATVCKKRANRASPGSRWSCSPWQLGEVVASAVTDADGRYLFEEPAEGRHTVRFGPLPPGLRFAPEVRGPAARTPMPTPTAAGPTLASRAAGSTSYVDAGVVTAEPGELGHIGDLVWDDLDRDGVQDAGEPGRAGVEVLLVGANTGQLSFTITDAAGGYGFLVSRAIAPDQPYRVVFVARPGRPLPRPTPAATTRSTPTPTRWTGATADFTLGPDEVDDTHDAGIVHPVPVVHRRLRVERRRRRRRAGPGRARRRQRDRDG